eukprot:scaffold318490_cov32-Tisochrysis_lutea.AAC.1
MDVDDRRSCSRSMPVSSDSTTSACKPCDKGARAYSRVEHAAAMADSAMCAPDLSQSEVVKPVLSPPSAVTRPPQPVVSAGGSEPKSCLTTSAKGHCETSQSALRKWRLRASLVRTIAGHPAARPRRTTGSRPRKRRSKSAANEWAVTPLTSATASGRRSEAAVGVHGERGRLAGE